MRDVDRGIMVDEVRRRLLLAGVGLDKINEIMNEFEEFVDRVLPRSEAPRG